MKNAKLYEVTDATGTVHDFYGDEYVDAHSPETCRACRRQREGGKAPSTPEELMVSIDDAEKPKA
jgi:hypothetical protein